ncbi:DsbA family protein [Marimonas arenosa]|uniref:DsbA family protein n=1 Tax=Marimonas arenosa TaxID=1795305 RepID=A0AAE3WDD2_9RHOB|nr:DsbA family protein [Marimonas arenosa]MDQ2089548.1 DsbA family protein [Marimonas arenosa]
MIQIRTVVFAAVAALAWALPATSESHSEAATDENAVIEMTLGAEDAPVTLIEYASFTCSHCANFHADQFKKLKADYVDTGKVRFILRDVYFDRVGLWAGMLARCEPDRYFGVAGLIFEKQGEWLNSRDPVTLADNLRKLGKVAGLEEDRINACMEDADKAKALVDWFQANMEVHKIEGTPALVIDDTVYGNQSYEDLKVIIDDKLGAP